jgi:hypothetical protein
MSRACLGIGVAGFFLFWCLWKAVEELEREIVETIKGPAQTVEDESVPDVNNR